MNVVYVLDVIIFVFDWYDANVHKNLAEIITAIIKSGCLNLSADEVNYRELNEGEIISKILLKIYDLAAILPLEVIEPTQDP